MILERVRPVAALLTALGTALALAGCAARPDADPHPAGGSLARAADLTGQSYVLGQRRTDEQLLLCEITAVALESAGASVTDRCDDGATATTDAARAALVSGDVNVSWEYTGQVWTGALGETARLPADQLYEQVKRRDLQQNGIVWLDRAGFDSSYAFAVDGQKAAQLGLRSLTDMAGYVRSGQPGTVCVDGEYSSRADGLRGLQQAYGVTIPPNRTQVLDQGVVTQSTADGVCMFGEVSTTDGRIPGLGLTLLDDNLHYHLPYDAVPTIRKDAYDRDPDVAKVLNPISRALDAGTVRSLNARVSSDGIPVRDVARAWLAGAGFVSPS